jgi:hypothetical protein
MRAVLAVGLASSILVLALPAWGATPRPAALKLTSIAPLVVKGSGFRPREAVLLTATIGNRRRFAGPFARADGTFVAHFTVRITSCTSLLVRAIGGRGSRATLKARPACESERPSPPKPPATQTERGPAEKPPPRPVKPKKG